MTTRIIISFTVRVTVCIMAVLLMVIYLHRFDTGYGIIAIKLFLNFGLTISLRLINTQFFDENQ